MNYYQNGYQNDPRFAGGSARRTALLRTKIAAAQSRAKTVGIIYLLASIALAALAFLPMLTLNGTAEGNLWVLTFWKPFLYFKDFKSIDGAKISELVVALLYTLILLSVVINVLRSFKKLGWLFKKKPSRLNGYNRNVFAMEDLGKLFSGSFHIIIAFGVLIYLLTKGNGATVSMNPPYAIVAGALALVVHFVCGIAGGSIHLYVVENGMIEEEKRRGFLIVPFVRNLIQFAAVGGICWFMLKTNAIAELASVVVNLDFDAITKDIMAFVPKAAVLLVYLCWLVLLKHATGITEYDRDGRYASGAYNFRIFAFLTLLFAGAAFGIGHFVQKKTVYEYLYVALIALGAFVVEIIFRKYPDNRQEDSEDIEADEFMDTANAMVPAPAPYGMPQGYAYPPMTQAPYGYPQAPQSPYGYPQGDYGYHQNYSDPYGETEY